MRKAVKTVEQHALVIAAFLGLATAALGVLSAYLKAKADTAVDRRQQVQSSATRLQSDKTSLQTRIAALQEENDNLKAQLDTQPAATSTGPAAVTRNLKVPISDDYRTEYIFLDQGEVSDACCEGDFSYAPQEATGQPELRKNSSTAYSIDVPSAGVGQRQCSDSVTRSPAAAPVRKLDVGTLICAKTDGGTSLLRVVAPPDRDGTLRLRQRFWPGQP